MKFSVINFFGIYLSGKMYLNGEGVTKDEQKALQYFIKGAEKGNI